MVTIPPLPPPPLSSPLPVITYYSCCCHHHGLSISVLFTTTTTRRLSVVVFVLVVVIITSKWPTFDLLLLFAGTVIRLPSPNRFEILISSRKDFGGWIFELQKHYHYYLDL